MEVINTYEVNPDYISSNDEDSLVVYPRIHMFTFDLSLISGILKHGSLGYSLMNMPIKVTARKNKSIKDSINVLGNLDISKLDFKVDLDILRSYIKSADHYDIDILVNSSIRGHTGLGLSTQILGGIYLCCAKRSGFELKINDLFKLGIGNYSALGLNLLFNSGMILEMGCKVSNKADGLVVNPKLCAEYETVSNMIYKINKFPFYTIVAIPKKSISISGNYEIDFWNNSLPDEAIDSYRIVYNVFETIIPSIIEKDFNSFIRAIKENITLGSKPLEEKVQSKHTKSILNQLRKNFGFAAVSSLGPTLYSFSSEDPTEALSKLSINDYTFFIYDQNGKVKKKINNDESILITSFACMGKTTFANKYPDIALDIESIHYARKYSQKHPNDEVAKGDKNWKDNPEYPKNYIKEVVDNIGKYKVIFLTAGREILKELDLLGVKYTILYPGANRKKQVLKDASRRGNDDQFVHLLDCLLSTDIHRLGFIDLNYESFEIINDNRYIEEYLRDKYIL